MGPAYAVYNIDMLDLNRLAFLSTLILLISLIAPPTENPILFARFLLCVLTFSLSHLLCQPIIFSSLGCAMTRFIAE